MRSKEIRLNFEFSLKGYNSHLSSDYFFPSFSDTASSNKRDLEFAIKPMYAIAKLND